MPTSKRQLFAQDQTTETCTSGTRTAPGASSSKARVPPFEQEVVGLEVLAARPRPATAMKAALASAARMTHEFVNAWRSPEIVLVLKGSSGNRGREGSRPPIGTIGRAGRAVQPRSHRRHLRARFSAAYIPRQHLVQIGLRPFRSDCASQNTARLRCSLDRDWSSAAAINARVARSSGSCESAKMACSRT